MRFNLILSGMAVVAATSFLGSCSHEPYVITAEEEYARKFYQTFGTVNENQDWTAASRNTLTVTTDRPTRVRVIADVDGKTYLFADYDAVDGYKVLNYDVPKHATNAKAIINGQKYPIKPGDKIDLTSRSRAAVGGIEDGLGISGNYDNVDVTIEPNQLGRALTLSSITMKEALERLPENGLGNLTWDETNIGEVTDNFKVTADEFYLFPEYWNTSHSTDNIIGIYWETSKDTPGAEEVTVTNIDNSTSTYYVIRIPVLQDPNKLIKTCDGTITPVGHFTDIDGWDEVFNKLSKKFEGKYKKETVDGTTKYYHIFKGKEEDGWLPLDWTYDDYWAESSGRDWNNEVSREVCKLIMNYSVNTSNCLVKITGDTTEEDIQAGNSPEMGNKFFYKSYGIHIALSEPKTFGFYIQQGNLVMYSERKLNDAVDNNGEIRQPSYVATYVDDTDTEGNDKRHLCFEDWHYTQGYNWDLNDMVFRVYGFDNIADGSMTPGKVTDIDDPDNDPEPDPNPDSDTTPDEEFDMYPWIIACEDLGATDDYDFNDVVFGVQHASGSRFVYVTALAAGGTLPARLYYTLDGNNKIQITGGTEDDSADPKDGNQFTMSSPDGSKTFDEWHKWFGSGRYHTEMINTTGSFTVGATVRITLSVADAAKFSISNEKYPGVTQASIANLGGFSLEIEGTDGTITDIKAPYRSDNPADNIPQLFSTTYKYCWPTERTSINTSHAGIEGQNAGTTPAGVSYNKGSFMHWVIAGDEADFHNTDPAVPRETIQHGWTGYSLTKK